MEVECFADKGEAAVGDKCFCVGKVLDKGVADVKAFEGDVSFRSGSVKSVDNELFFYFFQSCEEFFIAGGGLVHKNGIAVCWFYFADLVADDWVDAVDVLGGFEFCPGEEHDKVCVCGAHERIEEEDCLEIVNGVFACEDVIAVQDVMAVIDADERKVVFFRDDAGVGFPVRDDKVWFECFDLFFSFFESFIGGGGKFL